MILVAEMPTRVNDRWMLDGSIACEKPEGTIMHPLVTDGPNELKSRYQADFYDRVAFDIVTESVYHYPYPYVSEKTLRPLACKRLFVILGAPRTLELLEKKGFDIFSDFVNSEYDSTACPVDRFRFVVQEISRLINLPIDVFKEFYFDNAARFEHNFQNLKNLRTRECHELKSKLI